MIDITKLDVGDVVYKVTRTNNRPSMKKLQMVDEDGNVWYRYNKDLWTVETTPVKLVGAVICTVRGEIPVDEDNFDVYYFQYPDSQYPDRSYFCEYVYNNNVENDSIFEDWFATRAEADAYAEQEKKKIDQEV